MGLMTISSLLSAAFVAGIIEANITDTMIGGDQVGSNPDVWSIEQDFCWHGHKESEQDTDQNFHLNCTCDEGWRTAELTDTIHFLRGVCSQYECISDERCKIATGVPEATCPIPSWNCKCTFAHALEASFMGYETYTDGNSGQGTGGRCMGLLYYLSVEGTVLCAVAFEHGWYCFLLAAVFLLPFGQRRMSCTHRQHSLMNIGMRICGYSCDGNCTQRNTMLDDYAWSIYALQWLVWYHLAVAAFWLTCMLMWMVAVWLMVGIMLICGLIACLCSMHSCSFDQGRGRGSVRGRQAGAGQRCLKIHLSLGFSQSGTQNENEPSSQLLSCIWK